MESATRQIAIFMNTSLLGTLKAGEYERIYMASTFLLVIADECCGF